MTLRSPTRDCTLSCPKRVKLSRKSTAEQVEAMKQEIRVKINLLRDKLDDKECQLLAEVDRLGAIQVREREEMEQQLKAMNQGRTALGTTCSRFSQVKSPVDLAVEDLDRRIYEISRKLRQFQEIKSSWRIGRLESMIASLCSLSNVRNIASIYQSKSDPKWTVCIGEGPCQLSSPTSLAVQQTTDHIFVCDKDGKRVQVYNSMGDYIRVIDKSNRPVDIFSVNSVSMFSVCKESSRNVIVEINLTSLSEKKISTPDFRIGRINTMNSGLFFQKYFYTCVSDIFSKNTPVNSILKRFEDKPLPDIRFSNLQYKPLPGIRSSNLQYKPLPGIRSSNWRYKPSGLCQELEEPPSEVLSTEITPVALQAHGNSIYLLVSNSSNLIFEFSTDCKFVRTFCPSSLLSAPKSMCVDSRCNILVAGSEGGESEGESTKVVCLSPDGYVIHEMQIPFEKCVSIGVNSLFDIFLLGKGSSHGLVSL